MDSKAKSILSDFHDKLISKTFDEMIIFSLLILLRDYYKADKVIVGLSDFIAHREKDRGEVHKYLAKMRSEMIKATQDKGYNFSVGLVYTEKQITDAINKVFSEHGMTIIDTESGSGLVLCIISLFQNIELLHGKPKRTFATLGLDPFYCLQQGHFTLLGKFSMPCNNSNGDYHILAPVLKSSYLPTVSDDLKDNPIPFKVINSAGRLHLIPG